MDQYQLEALLTVLNRIANEIEAHRREVNETNVVLKSLVLEQRKK